MCGRTSLSIPQKDLENRFNANAIEPIKQRYNIGPKDNLAVIPNQDRGEIHQYMWGLIPILGR